MHIFFKNKIEKYLPLHLQVTGLENDLLHSNEECYTKVFPGNYLQHLNITDSGQHIVASAV